MISAARREFEHTSYLRYRETRVTMYHIACTLFRRPAQEREAGERDANNEVPHRDAEAV